MASEIDCPWNNCFPPILRNMLVRRFGRAKNVINGFTTLDTWRTLGCQKPPLISFHVCHLRFYFRRVHHSQLQTALQFTTCKPAVTEYWVNKTFEIFKLKHFKATSHKYPKYLLQSYRCGGCAGAPRKATEPAMVKIGQPSLAKSWSSYRNLENWLCVSSKLSCC